MHSVDAYGRDFRLRFLGCGIFLLVTAFRTPHSLCLSFPYVSVLLPVLVESLSHLSRRSVKPVAAALMMELAKSLGHTFL